MANNVYDCKVLSYVMNCEGTDWWLFKCSNGNYYADNVTAIAINSIGKIEPGLEFKASDFTLSMSDPVKVGANEEFIAFIE